MMGRHKCDDRCTNKVVHTYIYIHYIHKYSHTKESFLFSSSIVLSSCHYTRVATAVHSRFNFQWEEDCLVIAVNGGDATIILVVFILIIVASVWHKRRAKGRYAAYLRFPYMHRWKYIRMYVRWHINIGCDFSTRKDNIHTYMNECWSYIPNQQRVRTELSNSSSLLFARLSVRLIALACSIVWMPEAIIKYSKIEILKSLFCTPIHKHIQFLTQKSTTDSNTFVSIH